MAKILGIEELSNNKYKVIYINNDNKKESIEIYAPNINTAVIRAKRLIINNKG